MKPPSSSRRRGKAVAKGTLAMAVACLVGLLGAAAPPHRYRVTDDTVFDSATNLTWQRAVPAGSVTSNVATTLCANLVLSEKDDWRLPSVKELATLIDDTASQPAIDSTAFPATPADAFWTSSLGTDPSMTWMVIFDHGFSYPVPAESSNRVRCVR